MDALRINDSNPILTPYGGVKIPTGEVGDKHITLDQVKEYVRDGDFGDLQEHIDDVNNPHNVTKDQLGLGNVDNTSDLNKPISNLTQIAINLKEDFVESGTTNQYYRGDKTWRTLNRSAVGLGNVNNTSDLNKPISHATRAALDVINTDIDNLQQAITNISVNGSIVVHDPAVSNLIGQGTLSSPLSVNLTTLNNVYVSRIELDNYVTAQEYSAHVAQNNSDRATLVAADQQQSQNLNNHILQNSLEHTNILNTLLGVANRFQMMLEFEYAIGNFYWTTRRGNPNTWLQPIIGYETFWRPVVDRILMGVDPVNGSPNQLLGNAFVTIEQLHMPNHYHVFPGDDNLAIDPNADPAGGTFGNDGAELADNRLFPYDAASSGSPSNGRLLRTRSTGGGFPINVLNPVYTGYCWQRYDPSIIEPDPLLIVLVISGDSTDLNLRTFFQAFRGDPYEGVRAHFVIAEDVLVTATTTSNYAIVTGDWPTGSVLTMDVLGIVAGRGGNGATGSTIEFSATDGGPCIFASHPLSVNNLNIIAGGGGGGGWEAPADNNNYKYGGGGGAPFGLGGYSTYDDYMGLSRAQDSQTGGRELGGLTAEYQLATDTWTYTLRVKGGDLGLGGWDGIPRDLPPGTDWASFNGGLAGIAITGPVTVTGNPVLGR